MYYTVANTQIFHVAARQLLSDDVILVKTLQRYRALSPHWKHIDEPTAFSLLVTGYQDCWPMTALDEVEVTVRQHVDHLLRPTAGKPKKIRHVTARTKIRSRG